MDTDLPDLTAIEAVLRTTFDDRKLLLSALTHRSHVNEAVQPDCADNERLEFLGDALLDFVVGSYLYRQLPQAHEGELTAVRAALVCETALARYARSLDLGRFLRLGRGEAASGGRGRAALLSDAFEALVGALYLDQGVTAVERFVLRFLEPEVAAVLAGQRLKDAKSRFQEVAQHRWQTTPRYHTVRESGPDHSKTFVVQVSVGGEVWGSGEGRSKASAARQAAIAALRRLEPVDRGADPRDESSSRAVEVDRARRGF